MNKITLEKDCVLNTQATTGPNPTSGNIYHVPIDKVLRTDAQVDAGMKSIISCGAGSSEVFSKIKQP